MLQSALEEHIRYHRWATLRVLRCLTSVPGEKLRQPLVSSFGGIRDTIEHLYQADQIWNARLAGRPTGQLSEFVLPDSLIDAEREWMAVLDQWPQWAAQPDRMVRYRNLQGAEYEHAVWCILMHVINHGSYHRGQIVTMLRQAGETPVGTDLILYYREHPEAALSVFRE
jgi:uncharacterized damage-inducible protein DinB